MRARHRRIFNDGDRRVGGPQRFVAERARRHQLRHRDLGPRGRRRPRRLRLVPEVKARPRGHDDGSASRPHHQMAPRERRATMRFLRRIHAVESKTVGSEMVATPKP